MRHLSDLIIFSNCPVRAQELKGWASSLGTIDQCEILGWPEGEPVAPQKPTIYCLDGRDPEARRLRNWSGPVLAKLSAVLILPAGGRMQWQDFLPQCDWDVAEEGDLNQAFFCFMVNARLRLLETQEQINDLAGRFETAGHAMAEQWLRDDSENATFQRGSEFLANLSHEIRTPLNTIIGMSDLLLDSPIHGLEKRHLEVIKKSSQTLLALMENVLDLSRLEAGRFTFESSLFDIHDLIEKTFDLVTPRAHKKGLETTLEIDRELPTYIATDKARLQQILVNLLSNAVKFTERGEILLQVRIHLDGMGPVLEVDVHDTGLGLKDSQIARAFETHHLAPSGLIRANDGPGLGLLLARRFVEGLGGELTVDTDPEGGSTLSFRLPVTVSSGPLIDVQMREELAPIRGKRILLLDHHTESARVTAQYLRELDFEVEVSTEPSEFLSHLLHFQPSFDLALIDYETAGAQLSSWLSASLPRDLRVAIMLKSNTHTWSRIPKRKNALGVHHLLKPIKRGELLILLKEVFREHYPQMRRGEDNIEFLPRARADENFQILIVDDSKDNRYLMQAFLRDSYRATWFAETGKAAVDMFRSRRFQLIFMDLQMPEMDGITATQMIRMIERQNHWPRTPIFALTGHVHSEEKKRAFEAGCDDYIVKPVVRQVILDAIRKARDRDFSTDEFHLRKFDLT